MRKDVFGADADRKSPFNLTNQITHHIFCEAVHSGKEVRAVFCHITKAFDRVWHKGLLHKLRCLGVSDQFLKWFTSYLSGRRHK